MHDARDEAAIRGADFLVVARSNRLLSCAFKASSLSPARGFWSLTVQITLESKTVPAKSAAAIAYP